MTEARMQEEPEVQPGTFCWIELGTSDSGAAKNFYSQLFGWDYEDNSMGEHGIYSIVKLNGKEVGGLYNLFPELVSQGVPPHWLSYVAVTNTDESVAKAKAEGATVMNGPMDVMTAGRMAVIKDPTGATFAVWQAKDSNGLQVRGEPGSLVWNELGTRDTDKAGQFYSKLFGWTLQPFPDSPIQYTLFNNGGPNGVGGMYPIPVEMGPVPPHWLVYLAVADCDATVQKTTELGGHVMKPAEDIPGVGRFAILIDPQNAAFAVLKPQPQQ